MGSAYPYLTAAVCLTTLGVRELTRAHRIDEAPARRRAGSDDDVVHRRNAQPSTAQQSWALGSVNVESMNLHRLVRVLVEAPAKVIKPDRRGKVAGPAPTH
ncbi:MAG: hypothetical protein LC808_26585 [Actinobacteria bacterium]|nr:hypothetical protein [Actinomycetota bacterium]